MSPISKLMLEKRIGYRAAKAEVEAASAVIAPIPVALVPLDNYAALEELVAETLAPRACPDHREHTTN